MGRYDALLKIDNQESSSVKQTETPPAKVETREQKILKSGNPEITNSGFHENQKTISPEITKNGKDENLKSRKQIIKWSTQLAQESIRAIKRLAIDEGKKDYEILQEAVDRFLKKRGV